jgi:hypothetical protein
MKKDRRKSLLRGCSMATSVLHSQNFRFQITIYLEEYWYFFNINTFICALKLGANTSFSKQIFWKHIKMRSALEYNWHETAVFTIQKRIILTWENNVKYSAWQLSFQNVQNLSVKSKFHVELHYPYSSRWTLHFWSTEYNTASRGMPYCNLNVCVVCWVP